MILINSQQKLIEDAKILMAKYNLEEDEGYKIFVFETTDLKEGTKEISIAIQLMYDEKIVQQLSKIGWKTGHTYYTNGQVRWYSDGDSKDDYGDVEMIQMVPKY